VSFFPVNPTLDPAFALTFDPMHTVFVQGLISHPTFEKIRQHGACPCIDTPLRTFPGGEWTLCPLTGPITDIPMHKLEDKVLIVVHDFSVMHQDSLMALGLLIQRYVQKNVKKIGLLAPYLPYGRQHDSGLPILGKILHTVGIDFLITVDPHHPKAFDALPFPTTDFSGIHIFFSTLKNQSIDWIISPDHGGKSRAQSWAQRLGCAWTSFSKTRTETGLTLHHDHPEIFKNTSCVIIDDILDSGKTLAETTQQLRKYQAKTIMACITHGIFSSGCCARLAHAGLDHLWISDTITHRAKPWLGSGLNVEEISWTQALCPKPIDQIIQANTA